MKDILETITTLLTVVLAIVVGTVVGNFVYFELQKEYGSHKYFYTVEITTSEAGVYRNGVPTKLFDKATYKNKGFIVLQNENYQDYEDKIREKILDEIINDRISGSNTLGNFYSIGKVTVTSITRID